MAKQGEQPGRNALQVRGTVDVDKFKAARALAGEQATFELRAISPNRGSAARPIACVVCLICIICVVCAAARGEEFGIPNLTPLQE